MKELLLKRKGRFMLYVAACFLPVVNSLLETLSVSLLISSIEKKDLDYFYTVLLVTGVTVLLIVSFYFISRFMRISYMRDTILDVRMNAFNALLRHSYKHFHKKSKDAYVSNLINDVNTFEQQFFLSLINVIFQGGYYLVSMAILFFLDPLFAGMILLISILLLGLNRIFAKRTVRLQSEVSEANEQFTKTISNTFSGLEIIKLNNVDQKFLNETLKKVDRVERKKLHFTVFTDGQRNLMMFLGYLIFVGILLYIAQTILDGRSFSKSIFMIQLSNGCIWPIVMLLPLFNDLKASAKIYEKISAYEQEADVTVEGKLPFAFDKSIEVMDLKFKYEDKLIFNKAQFSLEKGKKYLIVGPSGAGKSTLMKLLAKLDEDYEGQILLDGNDYHRLNEKNFNDNIAFIYQDVFLFEDTIQNNITLYKDFSDAQIQKAILGAGLEEFMKEHPLDEKLLENGKNLSGGQRQRLSIARALVKDASILFVDEGTSSLNEELARSIEETLLSLDATVVAISHRFYEGVSNRYDMVLEVRDGSVTSFKAEDYFKKEVEVR